eukprot:s1958_g3.t2
MPGYATRALSAQLRDSLDTVRPVRRIGPPTLPARALFREPIGAARANYGVALETHLRPSKRGNRTGQARWDQTVTRSSIGYGSVRDDGTLDPELACGFWKAVLSSLRAGEKNAVPKGASNNQSMSVCIGGQERRLPDQPPPLTLSSSSTGVRFRARGPPSLDGGKSPFSEHRELRKENLRLPTLLFSRRDGYAEDVGEDKTPTITPTPQKKVGFSAPTSRDGPGTPFGFSERKLDRLSRRSGDRTAKHSETTKSQTGREKNVLFLGEDSGLSRHSRKPRKHKTWNCSLPTDSRLCKDREASTPSHISHVSPKSSAPPSPETSWGFAEGFAWVKGSTIGTGSHGCVFKALDKTTGKIFAVKQGILDDGNGSGEDQKPGNTHFARKPTPTMWGPLLSGMDLISPPKTDLKHDNIVETLGFEYADNHLYIYLEYVPGGSMAKVLHEFGALNNNLLTNSTAGVLQGLNYLHTRDPPVVHRDIKGANILVSLNFTVKLSDFGCSKRSSVTTSFTTIGSIPWMAPEVIQQVDGYGRKADIWSLGCVVLEMATAEKPWGNGAFENVSRLTRLMFVLRIVLGELSWLGKALLATLYMGGCTQAHAEVHVCLKRNADERPMSWDLLSHSFVKDAISELGRTF